MSRAFRPDLIVCDYDGVICRAETFTPDAIRDALRAFGARVGVEVPEPDEATLLGTLGYPSHQTYPPLLPAEVRERWPEMHQLVLDAMEERIRALGPRCLYDGIIDLLDALVADGRVLALASNCSERYQRVHREVLGLERWFSHLCHAQMPGIGSKADMVGCILRVAGAGRTAAMVGDRASDRDAALAHGLAFVACRYGYGCESEWQGACATVTSARELGTVLGLGAC